MDETQKRKVDIREQVKVFLVDHKRMGFSVAIIFTSLFFIYLAFIIFYSQLNDMSAVAQSENSENQNTQAQNTQTFIERLFPSFTETENTAQFDEAGLPIFKNASTTFSNLTDNSTGEAGEADAKVVEIERDPVLSYVVFDKPITIKKFIKNKPKICLEKVAIVTKKEEKSKAVEVFQNTLKSIEGFDKLEVTGILDEGTREQIYVFQKRYADILYKANKSKEPTRVIDKETTHFLNLLCSFDKEQSQDYVNIPTLRYAKKATREIIDYNTVSFDKENLNNKLVTGTEEAMFSPDGNFVIFRGEGKEVGNVIQKGSLGEITSEILNLGNSNKQILEKNISTLDFNNKNILVYGVQNNISMSIKLYDPVKNEVRKIAEIPMREWNVFWMGDGSTGEIGIYNKPSAFAEGIFMVLNTQTKKLERKTSPQFGFSAIKTNFSDFSIASIGGTGDIKTVLVNNRSKIVGDLGLKTFAEKCANTIVYDGIFCAVPKTLISNVVYPDDWYKGKYFSEDTLIYKTIAGTSTKIISTFPDKSFSVIQLRVHQNGIFFLDEKTLSLYSVEA